MRMQAGSSLAALLCAAGCHGYLQPRDETALPMRSVRTKGGELLSARDGQLFLSSGLSDIGAALGAALEESETGVLVVNRLRPDSALEGGDRIVHVAAAIPRPGDEGDEVKKGPRPEPPPPETLAGLKALPHAHAVRTLDDLRGYTCGKGWLPLDLGLVRRGSELVVRQPVSFAVRPLAVQRFDPDLVFRRNGIELCSLESWPAEVLPASAQPTDHLVTRVERDCAAGRAGLRPLNLVTNAAQFERTGVAVVRREDGTLLRIEVPRRAGRADVWIPLLFSFEKDGVRSHVGLGPLDLLFHSSSKVVYDAATDGYATTERWSFLTAPQGIQWSGQAGTGRFLGLWPLLDRPRMDYFIDRGDRLFQEDGDPSLSWGEPSELEDFLGAE